jgi:TonB family protein
MASLVHAIPAVAPDDPRLEGSKHVCALLVEIGADGVLKKIAVANKVASPFDEAAITAVRQSQFEPGSFKGKPVTTRLVVWVPFRGKKEAAVPLSGSPNTPKHPASLKNLTGPVPVNTPAAEFSDEARQAHFSGTVVLQVLIDEDGVPAWGKLMVRVGKGLDENALAAVRQYRFNPATLDGVPVPFLATIEVNFRFFSSPLS